MYNSTPRTPSIGTWWCKGKNCQCTTPPTTLACKKWIDTVTCYLQCPWSNNHAQNTIIRNNFNFKFFIIINVYALFNLVFVLSIFVGVFVFCFSAWGVFEEILKIVLFYCSLEDWINSLELRLFFLFLKFCVPNFFGSYLDILVHFLWITFLFFRSFG
jgi:hypothetical protein